MLRRVLITLALLAAVTDARAQDALMKPEAKAHLERGLELYEKKEYAAALRELEAGYAIDARPELLYARAQAERLAGDCEKAVAHYEQFLTTQPEPEREAAARANLARCKDELAAKAPPPAPAPTPTPAPTPAPAPLPVALPPKALPPPERSPWYNDVFGDVLLSTGVVAVGLGGFFVLASYGNESRAEDAASSPSDESYQAHRDRIERAERQRTTGVILGGVGLGLIGSAVLRYNLRDPSAPRVGVWVGPDAGGASFGRAF